MEMMVSVIMPTYNHEKYVAQAIESILAQKTKYRYEILIGDDCSNDDTRKVLEFYKKKYPDCIRVFYSKRNVKATKNGFYLMKEAKGKYFAFCDGDDCWRDEHRLEREVDFLEAHSAFSGICGKVSLMDENGKEISTEEIASNEQFWYQEASEYSYKDFEAWKMPGQISSCMIRNFILELKGDLSIYYKAHPMVGDRTLILFSVLQGKIACTNHVVSCYRYRINMTDNFMSCYHKKNLYADDFLLMKRLEKFVLERFDRVLDLSGVKKDRMVAAVVRMMKTKRMEDVKIVLKIIRNSGESLRYLYYAVKVMILKWIYWHITKKDKRILL